MSLKDDASSQGVSQRRRDEPETRSEQALSKFKEASTVELPNIKKRDGCDFGRVLRTDRY